MSTLQKHGGDYVHLYKMRKGLGICLADIVCIPFYFLRDYVLILKHFISILCNDTLNTCVSKEASIRA